MHPMHRMYIHPLVKGMVVIIAGHTRIHRAVDMEADSLRAMEGAAQMVSLVALVVPLVVALVVLLVLALVVLLVLVHQVPLDMLSCRCLLVVVLRKGATSSRGRAPLQREEGATLVVLVVLVGLVVVSMEVLLVLDTV